MKQAFKQQRENCFNAFIKNKGEKFPKNLREHYYNLIMNAEEPNYSEPFNVWGIVICAISGGVFSGLIFWIVS